MRVINTSWTRLAIGGCSGMTTAGFRPTRTQRRTYRYGQRRRRAACLLIALLREYTSPVVASPSRRSFAFWRISSVFPVTEAPSYGDQSLPRASASFMKSPTFRSQALSGKVIRWIALVALLSVVPAWASGPAGPEVSGPRSQDIETDANGCIEVRQQGKWVR